MNRQQVRQEMQFHLDARAAELEAAGLSAAEARRRAAAEFGTLEPVLEEARDRRPLRWTGDAARDLRFALRAWRRHPGFAAFAVLILALGIGANLVMFGLVQATLLHALPYAQDQQLTWLTELDNHGNDQSFSVPDFLDYQKLDVFSSLGGYRGYGVTAENGTQGAQVVPGLIVTRGLLQTLGVKPELGRWFDAREHQFNGPPAVILMDGYWRTHFGAKPAAVGSVLTTSQGPLTIVGVMPASFQLGNGTQLMMPYEEKVPQLYVNDRADSFILYGIGRLAPGQTLASAQAAVATLSARLAKAYPASNLTVHGQVLGLRDRLTGTVRQGLWLLLAAVGAVLLIVCANLANLLLARAAGRRQEMAVRSAIGAGKGRLARQLLTEGLLLAFVGCGLGTGLALAGLRATVAVLPRTFPQHQTLGLSAPVLGLALILALATGLIFSFAPMMMAWRSEVSGGLKGGTRGQSASRHRTHAALVVAEVALSMALLAAAGLMLRSLAALGRVPLGFNQQNLLTATVSLSPQRYASLAAIEGYFVRLRDQAAALPGVEAAGMVFPVPFTNQIANCFVAVEGLAPDPAAPRFSNYANVDAGYFPTMQIPLLAGRRLLPADDAQGAPPVVVIDRSMAQAYWGSPAAAIGRRLQPFTQIFGKGNQPPSTIVGVVGEVKAVSADAPANHEIYFPLNFPNGGMTLVVRTRGASAGLPAELQSLIRRLDPTLAVPEVQAFPVLIANTQSERLLSMRLLAGFAVAALLLAVLGLYAVLSFLVQQRRREIGIRVALGASRGEVQALFVRQALRYVLLGLALGTTVALLLGRLLGSLLFGVSARDPLTFMSVAALLALTSCLAAYVPARRAAGLDPLPALRSE